MQEYKRLHTFGHFFNIESHVIAPSEAAKLSPILDPKKFKGALYSPGDGCTDPSMYCAALIKGANTRGGQVIQNPNKIILLIYILGHRKLSRQHHPHRSHFRSEKDQRSGNSKRNDQN
jgi:glycine/D-amino acid oxidase-like deaminating enzyme